MNKVDKYLELLHSLRLKQIDLATKLNISRQRISDIFNGRSDFSEEQKIVLCKEYNVSLNWLIADIGEMFIKSFSDQIEEKKQKLEPLADSIAEMGLTPEVIQKLVEMANEK